MSWRIVKVNVDDAMEELQQSLGLEPQWQQKLQDDAEKLRRRQLASSKKKKKTGAVRGASPPAKTRARSLSSTTSDETTGKSRVQTIKERRPAKNSANKELADEFVDLGEHKIKRGETQKGISRMRVAKEIRNLEELVHSGAQAQKIRGVGRSAAAKLDEFLESGKVHALEEYEEEATVGEEEGGNETPELGDEGDGTGMTQLNQDEKPDGGDEHEDEEQRLILAGENRDTGEQEV
jgi:ribosome-binding protein aMBF1 (putative translation factor)